MKEYTVIIIEDEPRNQSLISNYLSNHFPEIKILAKCETVAESIYRINTHKPDILLSDIELPDGTAFDILVETKNSIKSLVFLTAFDQYAIKAIKYSALDYLLKPIMIEEFIEAIKKCKEKLAFNNSINNQLDVLFDNANNQTENSLIAIPNGREMELVRLENIIYFKADGNYTTVYFSDRKSILVTKAISHFDQILNPNYFFRVHSSYIVNRKQIKKLSKNRGCLLTMNDGSEIDVAVRRVKDFLEFMKLK